MTKRGIDGGDLSKDEEPTNESISRLIQQARYEFSQEDARDRIRYSVYNGDNEIEHPSHIDHQDVHMLVVNKAVEDVVGILANRPTVKIAETSLNTKKVSIATNVQNCLNALFPALEDDRDDDVWLKVLKDQILYGRAYDILEYLPTRWDNQPRISSHRNPDGSYDYDKYDYERNKFNLTAKLPLRWKHLPARGCFAWKDDNGIQQFLSIEERTATDVAKSYNRPDLLEGIYDDFNPNMHVVFCQYWNRSYYAYWVSKGYASQSWEPRTQTGLSLLTLADTSGDIVDKGPNIYGRVPVIETLGMASADINPARKHLSVIDPLIPISVYLDQLVSQKGSAIRVYCWPTPYIKTVAQQLGATMTNIPLGPEGRPEPMNVVPGQIMYLQAGQEVGWLVVPTQGPDIDKQIALIQAQADKLGIPSTLFDGSSQANGYLYNSMMSAVTGKLAPYILHTKRAHRARCEMMFRILEIHGEPLYIYQEGSDASDLGNWTNVGPKDVIDWEARYILSPDYEDSHPYDEAQDIAAAMQLGTSRGPDQGPMLSDHTILSTYLHIPDPEKEKERIRIEQIMRSPMVAEFLSAQAAIDSGMDLTKIQNDLGKLTPDQIKNLPPSLQQAAQQMQQQPSPFGPAPNAAGQPMPQGTPGQAPGSPGGTPVTPDGATGNGALAAPSTLGGIPGAPAAPNIPGLTSPLTPPGPQASAPPPARKGHGTPGRPAGQAHTPAKPTGRSFG